MNAARSATRKTAAVSEAEPFTVVDATLVEPPRPGGSDGGGALALYDPIKHSLAQMREQLEGKKYDLAIVKQNDEARRDRKNLVTLRTSLERLRLAANAADRKSIEDRISRRDELAADIEEQIRAVEQPIDAQIRADEQRREDERVRKAAENQARINAHLAEIAQVRNVPLRAVGKPAADIEAKIVLLVGLDVGPRFEEFEAEARLAHAQALATLREQLAAARAHEAAEVARAAQQVEIDRLRAQAAQAERREREAQQQRDREAEAARAATAAEQHAAQQAELARQREHIAQLEAQAKAAREVERQREAAAAAEADRLEREERQARAAREQAQAAAAQRLQRQAAALFSWTRAVIDSKALLNVLPMQELQQLHDQGLGLLRAVELAGETVAA